MDRVWGCEKKAGFDNDYEVWVQATELGEAVGGAGGSVLNVPSCLTPPDLCALYPPGLECPPFSTSHPRPQPRPTPVTAEPKYHPFLKLLFQ